MHTAGRDGSAATPPIMPDAAQPISAMPGLICQAPGRRTNNTWVRSSHTGFVSRSVVGSR